MSECDHFENRMQVQLQLWSTVCQMHYQGSPNNEPNTNQHNVMFFSEVAESVVITETGFWTWGDVTVVLFIYLGCCGVSFVDILNRDVCLLLSIMELDDTGFIS